MSDQKDSASQTPKPQMSKTAQGSKQNPLQFIKAHPLFAEIAALIMIIAIIGIFLAIQGAQGKIYIEKAEINAPIISLSPQIPGEIDKFYVSEGDEVAQSQKIAKVGDEIIYSKTAGIITYIKNTPGQRVTSMEAVAKMYDPRELRVIGRIGEDKGYRDIKPGQKVIFTVDAFGSKEYIGVVESVGQMTRQSDIVFSISDKREVKEFEVKVLFDSREYPELKNGMSAKLWIVK